jgi:hypothetical protein
MERKTPLFLVFGLLIGGFGFGLYGLNMYGFFAPRYEEVRLNTFENTKSYNQGMQQELQDYYLEYMKSDENGKQAIEAVIAHQYADYPMDRLPPHLRTFVESILNPTTY